ncbi:NAD(P)-dependent oxidoreductase [Bacillus sp. Marseille-P3661]|uniref:NAD(P)-dependent oxidoreductase n=1 Tax=Bacillus sp. Marseille-P3661 TaxID=1936234 RepID=UPI000C826990|nr:NAD(P)-dependent oxidoreductase [Bacillus sp. Marseille-P3661]
MKVGFIGVGVMGSRMVKRLLAAGYDVSVYNRSPEKVAPLVELGAHDAKEIESLVTGVDVICTCLSMPNDSLDVYLASNGVIKNAKEGTICIDFTTVGADTSQMIYNKAIEKGINFLDAPVSGGPEGAELGSLTIMVGGDSVPYEKVLPLLNYLGEMIQHLGSSGSGSIAKLINQYLVAVNSLAASEAMVTGAALGLDSGQLYNILKVSYGDSKMLRRHMESFVLNRQFEPGGAVKYIHKDVRLANKLVEESGLHQFTGTLAEKAFNEAMEQGLAELDMSAVIQTLEKKCNVVVKGK